MTITVDAPDPIYIVATSDSITDGFSFTYTTPGAKIIDPTFGSGTITDPATNTQYSITFTTDHNLGYGGGTGTDAFTIQIPDQFFTLVQGEATYQFTIELCEIDPNTNATVSLIYQTIDVDIFGTQPSSPPPPHKFTKEEKEAFKEASHTLDALSRSLDIMQLNQTAWKMANWISSMAGENVPGAGDIGFANSVIQAMLTAGDTVAGAVVEGTNPVLLTLGVASTIDAIASIILAKLAEDPPDSNYTQVYTAQPLSANFAIPGASAVDKALLTDSNNLVQDTLIMLTSAERYEGAELANATASMTLQESAFNAALTQYSLDSRTFATDLNATLQELVTLGVPNHAVDNSGLAAAQAYYASAGLSDPFLTNLMHNGISQAQAQALLNAIEAAQPAAFEPQTPLVAGSSTGGSVFDAISAAALQISTGTTPAPTSVQQEILGLYAALYNRAAESSGYSYWVGIDAQQADSGGVMVANSGNTAVTLADAAVLGQAFVNTQATYFNQVYASLSDSAFINALYVNLGGNAGDPGGIAYWANLLAQAEAGGASVQSARAGLVGQFVHDLIDIDLTLGPTALGLTAAQYQSAQVRQAFIDNKIAVSLDYQNASQQAGGAILIPHSVGDAAFNAAVTLLGTVTSDPATVTAAVIGINNAIVHQDLSLI